MADEKKVSGKTRAGTTAKPFPWEEAIGEQYERTKSRLKGLATEPEAELQRILEQYLPKKSDSREERLQKLEDLAMGFAGSTTGKVGNVRVKSTVKDPLRMAFPGIYQRPDVIAAEAASRVAPESPNLKAIFGVTRDDLYEIGKGRQGNLPGNLPGAAAKPKGSEAAARIMLPKNEQRILDAMAEAEKHPELVKGMDPWYVMDPLFQRMEQLLGRERAIEEYTKLNTLMGMASPGSEVLTEIPRGTAAYYLQKQGRFPEFVQFGGVSEKARGADFPADILNVPGHAYHKTAQALPMQRFLEAGEMKMESPKVPMYIEASGVPATGFQTATPVGDAHWSRAVGLADTRGTATRKGKEVVPGASVTNPEMVMLAPWWRESIANPLGLESVPAQARAWGTFSGQTGVTTPIGAPKLELIADKIAETARRLGVSLEKARDLVLTGETYAGKKKGGAIKKAEGGAANLTDLPDEVNPSNWREHLQNNVLADARALLGVKDGGVINLDDLIEQALKKKDGGVINLDELIAWTMAKDEHRKMKEGGAVKMADGGQTFPLQRPEEVTDLKPRPRTKRDELLEMLSKGVGSVHEFMAKPFGYENPPGEMVSSLIGLPGAAKTLERMAYGDPLTSGAGMTTNLLPETTEAAMLALGAAPTVLKATKNLPVGLSIKPTDMLDMELASKMKAEKIKAPANPVGFYNPAEKAALNLQRKKGPGSAFISDLKKQPGVTDERIAELGLTDLASNPNVTREDVIAAVEQNRIPLRESVRRPYQESDEFSETADALKESIRFREGGIQQVQAELDRVRATAPDSPLVQQYERKIETMRESIARDQQKLEAAKPSLYGPDSHPDYNMPGGENYREIRVALPENKAELPSMEGFTVETANENKFTGQRDIYIRDPQGNIVTNRYGFRGDDAQALRDEATSRARDASKDDNFYHRTHHGDEPNVLFHLRVADHVDEEGKKGLLIDELQSDWHQKGREKGYRGQDTTGWRVRGTNKNDPSEVEVLDASGRSIWQGLAKGTDRQIIEYAAKKEAVPDAPFKDNWYQLGLKRAIKEAADTGMDRVYLTTGARQADRYDLSKQVDSLVLDKSGDGYLLTANRGGSPVINEQFTDPKKLESLIGKEASKKLLEKVNASGSRGGVQTGKLEGVDLKVGGEGMKQYYDKNYKNYLEKYAKQHGGKLGETRLPGAAITRDQLSARDIENMMDNPEFKKILDEEFIRVANEPRITGEVKPQGDGYFKIQWSDGTMMGGYSEESARSRLALGRSRPTSETKAWNAALKRFSAEPVYYIDITDAMRESAKKGQSYAFGGGVFNTDPDITDSGRIIPEHNI